MAVRIAIGFDPREAIAYHVCCQSIIERASVPVSFIPLHKGLLSQFDGQRDGTNAFIFSRYLVPYLCGFEGHAIFMDGDMAVDADIAELAEYYSDAAVSVVKHDYKTKHPQKYLGTTLESNNVDYPRKNWSSVMVWNCAHPDNRVLTPEYVTGQTSTFLHRLQWTDQIGELPSDWNRLVGEDAPGPAKLYHYTLGIPGIPHYSDWSASWKWHQSLLNSLLCAGEKRSDIVKRAEERINAI